MNREQKRRKKILQIYKILQNKVGKKSSKWNVRKARKIKAFYKFL